MQTIRTFIAIPIDPPIRKAAAQLVDRLSDPGDRMKWVPIENLHLTLKFLGDVENTEIPRVCEIVRRCCEPIESFRIAFHGAGGFPTTDRPRVVWAGVTEGGDSLIELVMSLEKELAKLGFKPEARDYQPHLTLGRTRGGSRRGSPETAERIAANTDFDLGAMQAEELCVFASYLDKQGPSYHVMDTIRFD